MPWAMRASSSRIGASQPTCSYVGRIAITIEPPAISRMVSSIPALRPRRSAKRPSRMPPNGRKKKASAYVEVAPISARAWFSAGKNWPAKKTTNVA
jgi:hypothetical protein